MPVFESSADDVLGLWAPAPVAGALSFGIDDDGSAEGEVYRAHLPSDTAAARKMIGSGQEHLQRVDAALEKLPARLDKLVQRTQEKQLQPAGGVSFGIDAQVETGPEADLLALLAETDRGISGEVSFGLGDMAGQAWQAAKQQFDALIAQIDRDVLHFAWVETDIEGKLIARTTVDWSGDTQTIFDAEISPELAGLHESTLKTVARTRQLRLRIFATVASGSARVAALMTTPGGALLALPAVYQYVTQIAAQAGELQSIQ